MPRLHKSIIFFVCLILLLAGINIMLQRSLEDLESNKPLTQGAYVGDLSRGAQKAFDIIEEDRAADGEVIRRTQVIPGDDYVENVFYRDGKVIARQKIKLGLIVEQSGVIPNGRVRVEDVYQRSMGEEYYEDGQLKGMSRLYFSDGTLQKETTYSKGKVLLVKEYFKSGALHIMIDYQNALDIPGAQEVGIGKVYYPDGKLRYEWNLTDIVSQGFKRAYNPKGELVREMYFNKEGAEIAD